MSTGYRAVQWNRQKLVYDAVMLGGVALYIVTFVLIGRYALSDAKDPAEWDDLFIRAFGSCAFLLLTLILSIGPLARLDRRFLVLLYNRRHRRDHVRDRRDPRLAHRRLVLVTRRSRRSRP
jgi:hypothetical protein